MKKFNFDEFLWFIVLGLLSISIAYLIFTGRVEFYIGEKMIKYIYITVIMISIIAIFQFKNIFTSKSNINLKTRLIPIILTLMLGIISINEQKTFKHTELNENLINSKMDITSLYGHEDASNLIENNDNKQEVLVVNEDNPMVLEDIKVNPKEYIGKNLEIHGFVCKESYLNRDQLIIGRNVITCCAADSKIVGIMGQYDKAYELKENDKVNVKGVISSSTVKDSNNISHGIPIIVIEKLEVENNN